MPDTLVRVEFPCFPELGVHSDECKDHEMCADMAHLDELIAGHNLRVTVGQLRKKQLDDMEREHRRQVIRHEDPDWYCPECCDWYPKGHICLCRQESLV